MRENGCTFAKSLALIFFLKYLRNFIRIQLVEGRGRREKGTDTKLRRFSSLTSRLR